MVDKKDELRENAQAMLPSPIITLAYVEHQMDLMSQLIIDLSEGVTLSVPAQQRVDMLKTILQHSSINFGNLTHPLESYKIPKTAEYKAETRVVGARYLQAQIRAGVFGK